MKTLKLKLLAASMFACTAAFAQSGPSAPPSLGTEPTPTRPSSYDANRSNYNNDSYVLQQGNSQYARVDQSGNGGANTGQGGINKADVIQQGNFSSGNSAYQTQSYTGGNTGAMRNTAYINQGAKTSVATQTQNGSSNTASIIQYGGTNPDIENNTAYQSQTGTEHRAGIQQSNGSRDQAIQFQSGTLHYSTINQYGGDSNRAETQQSGIGNAAIITQH